MCTSRPGDCPGSTEAPTRLSVVCSWPVSARCAAQGEWFLFRKESQTVEVHTSGGAYGQRESLAEGSHFSFCWWLVSAQLHIISSVICAQWPLFGMDKGKDLWQLRSWSSLRSQYYKPNTTSSFLEMRFGRWITYHSLKLSSAHCCWIYRDYLVISATSLLVQWCSVLIEIFIPWGKSFSSCKCVTWLPLFL